MALTKRRRRAAVGAAAERDAALGEGAAVRRVAARAGDGVAAAGEGAATGEGGVADGVEGNSEPCRTFVGHIRRASTP